MVCHLSAAAATSAFVAYVATMLLPSPSAAALTPVTAIDTFLDPSKETDPVASPSSVIVLAVVSLPADATDLAESAVLSTFPRPTSALVSVLFTQAVPL